MTHSLIDCKGRDGPHACGLQIFHCDTNFLPLPISGPGNTSSPFPWTVVTSHPHRDRVGQEVWIVTLENSFKPCAISMKESKYVVRPIQCLQMSPTLPLWFPSLIHSHDTCLNTPNTSSPMETSECPMAPLLSKKKKKFDIQSPPII